MMQIITTPTPSISDPLWLEFSSELLAGLERPQKSIPSRFFYDARGSRLFEEITRQPEYYQTRTELEILTEHARDIAALVADRALIEFGSGSSRKTEILVRSDPPPAAYVAIDVSRSALEGAMTRIRTIAPGLPLVPVVGDFTQTLRLPDVISSMPKLGFFPGSTIGNFTPDGAIDLLRALRNLLSGGQLLIGIDLPNAPEVMEAAYDDRAGVTARFNMNVLSRANRELGADFVLSRWKHAATYDPDRHRVDMWLVSMCSQSVRILGRRISFAEGERIHTEISQKYTVAAFQRLAKAAGFSPRTTWVREADRDVLSPDRPRGAFSVHLLDAMPQ